MTTSHTVLSTAEERMAFWAVIRDLAQRCVNNPDGCPAHWQSAMQVWWHENKDRPIESYAEPPADAA